MISCDCCSNNINTLKEPWHGIPEGNDIIFICDSCYQKFIEYLKSKEESDI